MKRNKKQKQEESVYVVEPAHREKRLGSQHRFTQSRLPKLTCPITECPSSPPCARESSAVATPRNQILSQPHAPLSREASGSPSHAHPVRIYDSSPGTLTRHTAPTDSSPSQPLLGPRSWHTLGPSCLPSYPESHKWANT